MIASATAALALALSAGVAQEPTETYPEVDLARAELCYAHALRDISRSMNESGRVPGPAWFIRDWWMMRAIELGSEAEGAELEAALAERAAAEPQAVDGEGIACAHQAMDSGAVPF